jgi:hypothetical protein
MTNSWTKYVKKNFAGVKADIESSGATAKFVNVIKILSDKYQQEVNKKPRKPIPGDVCNEQFRNYCHGKGKVCHKNEKRRSCRKSAKSAKSAKKSASKRKSAKKSA